MGKKSYDGFTMIGLQEELSEKKIAWSLKDNREDLLKKLEPKAKK
ncbi:hypothetical protein LCGC14_1234990 [marine sediment metagenome]|uniref:Uncharacterized protein n=1 Tax=marine sediment metagenome TaxID=412755 RepID=A0A0F9LUN7_9ZZZZ